MVRIAKLSALLGLSACLFQAASCDLTQTLVTINSAMSLVKLLGLAA